MSFGVVCRGFVIWVVSLFSFEFGVCGVCVVYTLVGCTCYSWLLWFDRIDYCRIGLGVALFCLFCRYVLACEFTLCGVGLGLILVFDALLGFWAVRLFGLDLLWYFVSSGFLVVIVDCFVLEVLIVCVLGLFNVGVVGGCWKWLRQLCLFCGLCASTT